MAMQEWFRHARLGIFVHWGIYAVEGVLESWAFHDGLMSHESYMRQRHGFTASAFDARQWAALFRDAGAQYAVLTTKHHDGVALWDSADGPTTVRDTPAARDLVSEFAAAVRAEGLHVGLYYSLPDWTHPDYASLRTEGMDPAERGNPFTVPAADAEDPAAWQRFLEVHRRQLGELVTRFHPDLLWFDGEWERSPAQWRTAELAAWLRRHAPDTVVNGRLAGFGDYATPEQGTPIVPPEGPWELCLTVNDSWGFRPEDTNHKSLRTIVRIFTDTIGGGGRLLLDIGPQADGTITAPQAERLRGLGDWVRRHETAVLGTERGLPAGHVNAATTLSADRRRLFVFLPDLPRDEVVLRGLLTPVERVRVLGVDAEVGHHRQGGMAGLGGWDYVHLDGVRDAHLVDPVCTVLELTFADPLEVAREHVRD